jgi:hypothetical protein
MLASLPIDDTLLSFQFKLGYHLNVLVDILACSSHPTTCYETGTGELHAPASRRVICVPCIHDRDRSAWRGDSSSIVVCYLPTHFPHDQFPVLREGLLVPVETIPQLFITYTPWGGKELSVMDLPALLMHL